jgi:DNA-binding CsgD family transcriptional regulator
MAAYQLTGREQDITRLVLRGDSTAQIADSLSISPHTVQQHLKSFSRRPECAAGLTSWGRCSSPTTSHAYATTNSA